MTMQGSFQWAAMPLPWSNLGRVASLNKDREIVCLCRLVEARSCRLFFQETDQGGAGNAEHAFCRAWGTQIHGGELAAFDLIDPMLRTGSEDSCELSDGENLYAIGKIARVE